MSCRLSIDIGLLLSLKQYCRETHVIDSSRSCARLETKKS